MTPARLESGSEESVINISGATFDLIKDKCSCIFRGVLEAKNKGLIEMYIVEDEKRQLSQS